MGKAKGLVALCAMELWKVLAPAHALPEGGGPRAEGQGGRQAEGWAGMRAPGPLGGSWLLGPF